MSAAGFLFDEHIPKLIGRLLQARQPQIQVFRVGREPELPKSTPDAELLRWIERQNCWLVTSNRATMPVHLVEHLQEGRHIPGIFIVAQNIHLNSLVEELRLIWGASLPDEYRDQIVYLPLQY